MRSKIFSFAAVSLSVLFLAACSHTAETPPAEIENREAVEAVNEIETIEGTPAEKVEAYNEKAIEAQTKLQLLLESEELQSSFLDTLIPTAFAEEATIEDQIAALLEEIKTYTELAAESATEATDPGELKNLLDAVQEIQATTSDIVTAPPPRFAQRFRRAAEDVETRIAEIDEATAEVEDALESGATEIEVDIETDIEDFLASGVRRFRPGEQKNAEELAELKIQNAVSELEKVQARIAEGEISAEEAETIIADLESKIETAKDFFASGDFDQAIETASEGKRDINKIKNVVARAKDAKARAEELKELAEAGDAVAAEQLEKLQAFIEKGKDFKEILAERKEAQREFREEAKDKREESGKIRRGLNSDLLKLKKAEAAGEISASEFEAQKAALLDEAREVRKQKNEAEKELRQEHRALLQELSGLPPEEAKAKREELREEIQTRERVIRDDQKRLYDAIQTGNEESIEAVKKGIKAKREKAQETQRDNVKRFIDKQAENLTEEQKAELQKKRQEVKQAREEFGAAKQDAQELRQEDRDEFHENREEIREDLREIKKDVKDAQRDFSGAVREVKQEVKNATPAPKPDAVRPPPRSSRDY